MPYVIRAARRNPPRRAPGCARERPSSFSIESSSPADRAFASYSRIALAEIFDTFATATELLNVVDVPSFSITVAWIAWSPTAL